MRRVPVLLIFCVAALGTNAEVNSATSTEVVPKARATGNHDAYRALRYRLIGPFRAGRTVGAVGVPERPGTFYIGVNNGGVWTTDDYGGTWRPLFDDAPSGSIGDIAVAPSDSDVIYVGSGEGLHRPDLSVGDGMFRSDDGGHSWRHIGLADVQQVARVVVHPQDANVVYVAGLGHPYGPNAERGVFRTRDGGESWEKILYIDEDTGAAQVELDPNDANVLYADMWDHREGPWENARFSGEDSGLFKSSDGGTSWRRLEEGLPGAPDGLGRIGVGIAPGDSSRLYATVDATRGGGIYRSDDGGERWRRVSDDERLWGRGGDFAEIRVHPHDPDIVFVGNIAAYRSDDGGATWTSIKGAPGGDDYHRIWIDPLRPDVMLFATDQGATVTVNGGRTWSSWYNQPTAQLYHVSTDNAFPYRVYGGQQESGAIAIASRGNGGQITLRDWGGVGADEYAYVAPDPRDPNIVFGGRVMRWDRRTGQAQNVAPEALRSGAYRILRSMPLIFSPAAPDTLYFATNVLWRTTSGGQSWDIVSPDLSREQPQVPASVGSYRTPDMARMARRGVIYSVSPSPLAADVIWAGTDDGLLHLTSDGGKTWRNVTPPALRAWDKIAQIDAGHFDVATAYVAVNAMRRDDMRPHVFRTHDGGEHWQRVTNGLEGMGPVNVVREDPLQPGLLFVGTERQVAFSSDDGERWRSLRQNMPASSIRDLVIHHDDYADDLVVGTHGRSIWILDGIAPLRELAAAERADAGFLYSPPPAVRVRWNMFSDTPMPPEEPGGENPPDGAPIDYVLPTAAQEVVVEILDVAGRVIRRYSSADEPERLAATTLAHPTYWSRPPQIVATSAGHHRFVWDLRYPPPRGAQRQFSIAAVQGQTPSAPRGPYVAPGEYRVRLLIDGVDPNDKPAGTARHERSLRVLLDPRLTVTAADIDAQTDASMRCYATYERLQLLRERVDARLHALRTQAYDESATSAGGTPASTARADSATTAGTRSAGPLLALRGEGAPREPDLIYEYIVATPPAEETLVGAQQKLLFILNMLQSADVRPTSQAIAAVEALESAAAGLEQRARRLLADHRPR